MDDVHDVYAAQGDLIDGEVIAFDASAQASLLIARKD
jgi:hypothetical protein